MDTLQPQPPPEPEPGAAPAPERPLDRIWSILPREFVREALERALADALEPHEEELGPEAILEARQEASRLFLRAARQRARRVRGVPRSQVIAELEASHRALLSSRDEARAELADLEHRTQALRANLEDKAPELDREAETRLDRDQEARLHELLREYGRKPNRRTDQLVAALVADARARQQAAMAIALAEYPERIALLERRMAKLKIALWRTEKALLELSRNADGVEGKASIFKEVQGLEANDPMFQAKQGALKTLYEENVRLREDFARAEGA